LSLFLIDAGPQQPGVSASSYYLAQELRRLGMPFRYYIPEHSPLHSTARIAELPVEPLRTRTEKDVLGRWRLARAMKHSACHLVHAHDPVSQPLAAAAAARAKVPLQVVTWDGTGTGGVIPSSRMKSFRSLDLVIVREEEARDTLTEQGFAPEAIRIIPPGRDFSPYTQPEERDFLHREFDLRPDVRLIGVKTRVKGGRVWPILRRVTKALEGDLPGTRVVILGEGGLEIEGRKGALLPEGVLYYMGGGKAFDQVISSLDLLVVLSSEVQEREQLQAAMAAGVLLVTATKRGLPRELVHEKTGFRFPPEDPSALVRSLSEFVKNREMNSRLAREGQITVLGKYSVQAMARRLIKEYERIARRKGVALFQTPRSGEAS